jgi:hypothetical protein
MFDTSACTIPSEGAPSLRFFARVCGVVESEVALGTNPLVAGSPAPLSYCWRPQLGIKFLSEKRWPMKSALLAVLAVCAVALLLSGAALAQMVNHNVPLPQGLPETSTSPLVIADFAAITSPVAGMPCFGCVNGTTAGTFGLASPSGYVALSDTTDQLVIYYTDVSCPLPGRSPQAFVTFKVVQGKTIGFDSAGLVQGFSAGSSGYVTQEESAGGSQSWAGYGFVPGPATLVGGVRCQGQTSPDQVRVPIYFYGPETSTTRLIIADLVAITSPQSGVPCFDCVNGTTPGTFGLSSPFGYVSLSDTNDQLVVYYTDVSCPNSQAFVRFSVVQGTNTSFRGGVLVQGFTPNSVGYETRPAGGWSAMRYVPGPATLIAGVTCQGEGSPSPGTLRVPIYFH